MDYQFSCKVEYYVANKEQEPVTPRLTSMKRIKIALADEIHKDRDGTYFIVKRTTHGDSYDDEVII